MDGTDVLVLLLGFDNLERLVTVIDCHRHDLRRGALLLLEEAGVRMKQSTGTLDSFVFFRDVERVLELTDYLKVWAHCFQWDQSLGDDGAGFCLFELATPPKFDHRQLYLVARFSQVRVIKLNLSLGHFKYYNMKR